MMLSGPIIAPGIACGPVIVWKPIDEPVAQRRIAPSSVCHEKQRLQQAMRRAQRELEERAKDVQSYLEQVMASRFPQVMSVYGRAS